MSDVFKIALGILFGVLMLWIVGGAVIGGMAYQGAKQITHAADEAVERQRRIAEARRQERLAQEAAKKAADDQRLIAAHRSKMAQQAKDQAWAAFWQPSEECMRTTSVECGNQHIRARREFERRYAAGQL